MKSHQDYGALMLMAAVVTLVGVVPAILHQLAHPQTAKERETKMLTEAKAIAGQFPWRVVYASGGVYTFSSREFYGSRDIHTSGRAYDPRVRRGYDKMYEGDYILFEIDTTTVKPKEASSPFDLLHPRYLLEERAVNPYLLRL